MAPYGPINKEFAAATVKLVEGETLQAQAAKNGTLDRETYARVIANKTAVLFGMAAKVGGMIGQGTPEQVEALSTYGFNVGLAFQIVDDILDLIADSQKLGKDAGIDIAQGRGLATALTTANGHAPAAHAPVAVMDAPADPLDAFKQKMLSGGYIEEGRAQAKVLAQLGVDALSIFAPSPAIDELKALADLVINREY
jgi:geranylgeranyl pyrophosphate synthase